MAQKGGSAAFDIFIAYKFIKLLSTPWKETEAYKLGIIDDKGKILKKRKSLSSNEKPAYPSVFYTLVWKIKRLLDKLPPTRTRLGSLAAALWLLKEDVGKTESPTLLEDIMFQELEQRGIVVDLTESLDKKNYLVPGMYRIENDIEIMIEETIKPIDIVLGVPLYKVGERIISDENIQKIR